MTQPRWWTFSIMLVILFIPSVVQAQRAGPHGGVPFTNPEIDVQLRNSDGSPGPRGVHVVLELAEGGPVDDCQTIEGGTCRFIPPSSGVYIVKVRQSGYKEVVARIDLTGTEKGFATLDLRPIPGETPPGGTSGGSGGTVSTAMLGVPENARAEFEKGQADLKDNKVDSSISHFKNAIKLHDAFPQAYTMLGTAYVQANDMKAAQPAFEKAIQLDPKTADAFIGLGAMYNQEKNYQEAEKALKHALELNPDAALGQYELAKTYWALGRWQDADPYATKAVAAMPQMAPAHVLMGNILLRKRDAPGALAQFQEYLRLDPNGPMAPSTRDLVARIQKALGQS